jgi:CRISPR-associated protein Csb2
MPIRDNTTKVIDAFAYVGNERLRIGYPGNFADDERVLARELVERLPYLGRAESWVVGRVLDASVVPNFDCGPLEPGAPCGPAERVELLAPEVPEAFLAWRSRTLERAWQERLTQKAEDAARKRKKPPSSLTKGDKEKVAASFPSSWMDAIGWDTATLQRLGWDMPPGARWVAYAVPKASELGPLEAMSSRGDPELLDTALLALSADAQRTNLFPPLRDVVRRMDMLHKSLVSLADPEKAGRSSAALSGKLHGNPLRGHRHAHLLPLSLACRPDRFDHVLVYAPMGFDAAAREALGTIRKTYAKDMPELFVTLAGLGTRDDFVRQVSDVRLAPVWRSRTPFIPPRFLKPRGRNSLRGQIEHELAERGVDGLRDVKIELDDGGFVSLDDFESGMRPTSRFRNVRLERGDQSPPARVRYSLELHFERPVRGPIALGYACHFGLGVFGPVSDG